MYYNSVMPNIRKMNGGLLLNDTHESKTIKDAIEFFKVNSTFSILTNSSRACITFKAVLKPPVESPFIHIRSGIIEQPVKTLLFKYYPINTLNSEDAINFITHKHRGGFPFIPLSKAKIIEKEYNAQLQVYQTTYNTISSAYEPVCPYPIHCFTDLDKEETIQEIIAKLDKTDTKESNILIITDTLGGAIDGLITDTDTANIQYKHNDAAPMIRLDHPDARASITTLGCIVMEFMDGYTTLKEYLDRHSIVKLMTDPETKKQKFIEVFGQSEYDEYKKNFVALKPGEYGPDEAFAKIYNKVSHKANSLAAYELVRLKQIGFIHGDLHDENIMYNPNYKYITNDDNDVEHKGRALLIDFGESLINKTTLKDEETQFYIHNNKDVDVYERKGLTRKFHLPYTFEMIYTKRLEVSLAFRETRIQGLEQMLSDCNALSKEEKTKFVQDKKIQLKLGLITNSKWPTNFVLPKVDDFKKEEFNEQFQKVQIPIFEKSKEKIQIFTQTLDDIRPNVQALIELEEPAELTPAADTLLKSNANAFNQLEHLTKKFTILFPTTPSAHGGRRYIHSHKKHKKHKNHKNQTDFTNRLKHRIRTTLRIKRRQTKRRKRGKRSKKGK